MTGTVIDDPSKSRLLRRIVCLAIIEPIAKPRERVVELSAAERPVVLHFNANLTLVCGLTHRLSLVRNLQTLVNEA